MQQQKSGKRLQGDATLLGTILCDRRRAERIQWMFIRHIPERGRMKENKVGDIFWN
jgi:hypothetical protein